ncbi:DNA-binding domain-containing protein [Emergencia sp.]|uniref:DNA-binding domain-containing protein n=1 Tax=Emergencia sp. TaxID=1926557 RepID=UPI003AF1A1E6
MKYYIIDDEIGTVKTLENIVEIRGLGDVIGYATDPEKAVGEILALNPEIVLVDLLMSKMDGIALVDQIKGVRPQISFVMISQVADKGMIEQAYNAGVEFFINKPINIIEVEKVLNHVSDKIKMNSLVAGIKGMFAETEEQSAPLERKDDVLREINVFLGLLGMLGEKGTSDILSVCQYLIGHNEEYSKNVLTHIAAEKLETSKNLEQRMRRAIKKGLTNVANLGIDDYSNEVFQVYANYVFDFKNIKDEMDFIKGSSSGGGRVNISKFIEGLLLYRKSLL